MDAVIESLGWAGAVVVLGGYLLFSAGKIPNGPLYQVFNLVGALFVCVNVCAHQAWPSTIVNGIWGIIAGAVLVRMWAKRRAERRAAAQLPTDPPVTTAVLPIVDSVPVITAALAIVVAAAAQEQAAQERAAQEQAAQAHADSRTIDA